MSQNIFPVRDGVECMVGWDDHMGTFFAQVYRVDEEGERIGAEDNGDIHWVSGYPCKIRTVEELVRLLKPHATIPEEILKILFEIEVD
jgi:hypothetical protein